MKKILLIYLVSCISCLFLNCSFFVVHCYGQCKANFAIIKDSTINNSPYAFLFYDESTGIDIYSWDWDFGDSIHSPSQFPMHQYAKAGTYYVCLTIKTGSAGNITCQNKYCSALTVDSVLPASCKSSFYYYTLSGSNDTLNTGSNTYYFSDNSQGDIFSWIWNFGDGSTSNEQNPQHTFNPGTYNVCLTVNGKLNDTTDCQDNSCQKIIINKINCYADFIVFQDSVNKLILNFFDASAGKPDKWYWEFGDGSTSQLQYPSHKYGKAGTYDVCLTIINDSTGCKDMRCYTFYVGVAVHECKAAFTFFPDNANRLEYYFKDISNGHPTSYLWDFGDTKSSAAQNPSHTYAASGIYNVCLTVFDSIADGCNDKFCQTIFVGDKPSTCKAFFIDYQDTTVITPNFFRFTDMSAGSPAKWYWDFGDNTIDTTQQNPTHAYATPGTYYPCLTIKNTMTNCLDIYCSQIIVGVQNGYCHAEFNYNIDGNTVTSPNTVAYDFTDISKGNIATWNWDFGDDATSDKQNPEHIFYPGTYKVCLSVTSLTNNTVYCSDIYCSVVFVDTLTPPPANYCKNYFSYKYAENDTLSVNFYGNVFYSEPPVTYKWSFGDNNSDSTVSTAMQTMSNHTYAKGGQYTVTLKTTDAMNCTYISTQTINIGSKNIFPYIAGQIFASGNNDDKGAVILGSLDLNTHSFTYIDTCYVDSIGAYRFNNVPYGIYNIFSIPLQSSKYYSTFIPTYASDSWDWISSDFITINKLTPNTNHNIYLIPLNNLTSGTGSISGYVTYGGTIPFNTHYKLEGIEVLLFDMNDNVLDYKLTDKTGRFGFPNLAFGTYKVYIEIWGMYSTAAIITIGPDNQNVTELGFSVNFMSTPFTITLLTNNISSGNSFNVGNIYPNPANSIANINISLKQPAELKLSIYNSIGQLIQNKNFTEPIGNSTLQLDAANLPSGLYNVVIAIKGNATCTRRFVKN